MFIMVVLTLRESRAGCNSRRGREGSTPEEIELLARPAKRGGGEFGAPSDPVTAAAYFEHCLDLFCVSPLTDLPQTPARIVEFVSASRFLHQVKDLCFPVGEVFVQPMLKQRRNRPR